MVAAHRHPVEREGAIARRRVAPVPGLVPAGTGPPCRVEGAVAHGGERFPVEQRRPAGGPHATPPPVALQQDGSVGHGEVQPVEHLIEVGRALLPQSVDDDVEELAGRERHRPDAIRPEEQDGRAAQAVRLQRHRRAGAEDDGVPTEPDLDVSLVARERQVEGPRHRSDPPAGPETEEVLGDQPVDQRPQNVAFDVAAVLVGSERKGAQRESHVPILACRALS